VFRDAGVEAQIFSVGTLVGIFFASARPTNYDEVTGTDAKAYATFFHEMLSRGVAFAPSAFEVAFPSLAHTKDDLERTADLARPSLEALR
jgi:glutamate-1-semialdehyde 2,1-aminomutase